MPYPTEFQQKTLWNAATGVSILVLGALIVGLIWLLGYVFGFLQPVLIPLIVAGIIAYVLDPVVRFLEKRGMSRLWSVVTLFLGILVALTLLVAAVLPGVQRSRGALKDFLNKTTQTTQTAKTDPVEADGSTTALPADDSEHLAPALARSLDELRRKNAEGPIGWVLTETDDLGKPVPLPVVRESEPTLDEFARTRGGRMLVQNLDVIFSTGRSWLTAGSTKVLGFLGLALGMIMVPVYLFFSSRNPRRSGNTGMTMCRSRHPASRPRWWTRCRRSTATSSRSSAGRCWWRPSTASSWASR